MKVLLIVNSSASSVTARGQVVIQKALSADHDVTVAETSRRGHATRLAQGAARDGHRGGRGARRRRHPQRGGQRPGRHRHARWPPLPGGSTNVFARTHRPAQRPDRGHRRPARRPRPRVSIRRVGLGSVNGRYFLFHVGMGFDAAVVEQVERRSQPQALRRPPAVRLRRLHHLVPPLRPQPAPLRGAPRRRHGGRRRLPGDLPQHEPVHVPRQPPARPRPRGRRSTAAWPWSRCRTLAFATMLRIIGSALAGGQHLRTSQLDRPPRRPRAASSSRATARSRTRSTATTSATPSASRSATSPTSSTSSCPLPRGLSAC